VEGQSTKLKSSGWNLTDYSEKVIGKGHMYTIGEYSMDSNNLQPEQVTDFSQLKVHAFFT
jgi:hypothetical protein